MIHCREIAFIAYPVTDVVRAREFYEGVLGLRPNAPLKSDKAPWIEYDIGACTLGIGSSPQWPPSKDGASVAIEVEDFDSAVGTLRAKNIDFVVGPIETPVCRMVTVRDPDGNKITLHRRKTR